MTDHVPAIERLETDGPHEAFKVLQVPVFNKGDRVQVTGGTFRGRGGVVQESRKAVLVNIERKGLAWVHKSSLSPHPAPTETDHEDA